MLRISKLSDYATLIMHCLASAPAETPLSANDIARTTHLQPPTASKILKVLSDAKLVISTRGVDGGYQLAEAPHAITIAQIITAIEGSPALTECAQQQQICVQDSVCALKHNWKTINQFVLETLKKITLADMAKPFSLTWLQS